MKGAPAPKWMKEGRPAVDKGYDLGYELANYKINIHFYKLKKLNNINEL